MDPNDKEWVLQIDCESEADVKRIQSAISQHFRNKDLDVNTCRFDEKDTLYVVVNDDELCSDQSNLPENANLRKETRWEVPEFEYVSREFILEKSRKKSKKWQELYDKIDTAIEKSEEEQRPISFEYQLSDSEKKENARSAIYRHDGEVDAKLRSYQHSENEKTLFITVNEYEYDE